MLQHEQLGEERAAEVRVTAEDLAAALTSLEVRKAGIDGRPDTIALGDAIRQLDLDATPEELLAEVQALQSARRRLRELNARARARRWVQVSIFFALAVVVYFVAFLAARTPAEPPLALTPAPTVHVEAREPYPLLSAVPVGEVVGVDFNTLVKLANGKAPADLRVDARVDEINLPPDGRIWKIRKTAYSIVVQAWADQQSALQLANGSPGRVWSYANPGGEIFGLVSIEIDIGRFRRFADAASVHRANANPDLEYIYGVRLLKP